MEAKDWDWEEGMGFRRCCCEGRCCEADGCWRYRDDDASWYGCRSSSRESSESDVEEVD